MSDQIIQNDIMSLRIVANNLATLETSIESLRATVARLTAELAAVKQERDALAAQVKDLLSDVVKSDLLDQQLEMTLNERDALAAALDKFGQHQPYCYETKTATEKGFVAPPYRHCTCWFSQVIEHTAAIHAQRDAAVRKPLEEENAALAAALDKFGQHQPYCYETKTATEKGFIAPPYRHCTCGFSQVIERTAAILAAVKSRAKAEGRADLANVLGEIWGTFCPDCGPTEYEYFVDCLKTVLATVRSKARAEAFHERESAYVKISQQLLAKYVELFPAYAWTDEQTAIDLMAAEIATLRIEKAKERAEGMREAAELCRIKWGSVGTVLAADLDRLAAQGEGEADAE